MISCNDIRVWRRLVACLNGVQEAAGSTPVTRTSTGAELGTFLIGYFKVPNSTQK